MRSPLGRFPLLPRKKNTDKSAYGHVLVAAGSKHLSGAPRLVSRASLVSGAGWVTVAIPEVIREVFSKKALPELMHLSLPQTKDGSLASSAAAPILSFIRTRGVSCLVLGPGLTYAPPTSALVRKLVKSVSAPIVLDADGLNAFKGRARELKKHRGPVVLTPHAGEFERLFSAACPGSSKERAVLAKKLSRLYDVTIVLKGHRTLVVRRDRVYENRTGNPGMAKAGSGDVLAGIIGAFIAQGLDPFKAACWAVYFHGLAGDKAVKVKSELGLLASDIIDFLPVCWSSSAGRATVL